MSEASQRQMSCRVRGGRGSTAYREAWLHAPPASVDVTRPTGVDRATLLTEVLSYTTYRGVGLHDLQMCRVTLRADTSHSSYTSAEVQSYATCRGVELH